MGRHAREQEPPPEYAGHADDCGCGCQLTAAQWRAAAENESALLGAVFDGRYTTNSAQWQWAAEAAAEREYAMLDAEVRRSMHDASMARLLAVFAEDVSPVGVDAVEEPVQGR